MCWYLWAQPQFSLLFDVTVSVVSRCILPLLFHCVGAHSSTWILAMNCLREYSTTLTCCCVTRVVVSLTHGIFEFLSGQTRETLSLSVLLSVCLSTVCMWYNAFIAVCSLSLSHTFLATEQESFELMLWHFILCMCKRFHRSYVPGVLFISSYEITSKCHGEHEMPLTEWVCSYFASHEMFHIVWLSYNV